MSTHGYDPYDLPTRTVAERREDSRHGAKRFVFAWIAALAVLVAGFGIERVAVVFAVVVAVLAVALGVVSVARRILGGAR